MSALLQLPRELRDLIFKEVILSPQNAPPRLESTFDELLHSRQAYQNPGLYAATSPDFVQYLRYGPIANATNLLLLNRQIHAETVDIIKSTPETRTYRLNLIILDEALVLATWLLVPSLITVDQVNTKFRILGSSAFFPDKREKYKAYSRLKGFKGGDGGPPAMYWQIYSILERFLLAGPIGEPSNQAKKHVTTIKILNIDVETPSNIDPSRFGRPLTRYRSSSPNEFDHVLDPEYFIHYVVDGLKILLRLDHHALPYGQPLYEHMDEITVRKDGEEWERFDLCRLLQGAPCPLFPGWDEDRFGRVKTEIWEKREKRKLRFPSV